MSFAPDAKPKKIFNSNPKSFAPEEAKVKFNPNPESDSDTDSDYGTTRFSVNNPIVEPNRKPASRSKSVFVPEASKKPKILRSSKSFGDDTNVTFDSPLAIEPDTSTRSASSKSPKSPPPQPKIAAVWTLTVLASQLVIFGVHALAAFQIGEEEFTVAFHYIAETMFPVMHLLHLFIYLSNPTGRLGPLEITSTILTATSRCLLVLTPTCLGGGYGAFYGIDGCLFALIASLIYRSRRVAASSSFSHDKLCAFVYVTVPTTLISAAAALCFIFGESLSCLREKGDAVNSDFELCDDGALAFSSSCGDYKMNECDDVIESNTLVTWCFLLVAFTQILVLPFLETSYTTASLVRFDMAIGEQLQLISFAFIMLLGTFIFASSQDDGYEIENQVLTSRTGRSVFRGAARVSIFFFVVCTAVSQNMFGTSDFVSTKLAPLAALGQRLRSRLRTLHSARLAPIIRVAMCGLSIVCLIPATVTIVLATLGRVGEAEKAALLVVFAYYMHLAFAGVYFVSTPKGKASASCLHCHAFDSLILPLGGQTSEKWFFVVSVGIHWLLVLFGVHVQAGILGWTIAIVKVILEGLATFFLYFALDAYRSFMVLHTDSQIDRQFAASIGVLAGTIGPALFMFAEAAGCILTEDDPGQCERLSAANSTVMIQLLASSLHFLGTGIAHLYLTMDDIVALNTDVGNVVRGLALATTWTIALVAFGARPRGDTLGSCEDADLEAAAEEQLLKVTLLLRYCLGGFWFSLMGWETIHLNHEIRKEQLDSRMRSGSETEERSKNWLATRWTSLVGRSKAFVETLTASTEQAKASPLFSWIACSIMWLLIAPNFVALFTLGINGWRPTNFGALVCRLAVSCRLGMMGCFACSYFMDLEEREGETYMALHLFVPIVSSVLELIYVAIVYEGVPYANLGIVVATVAFVRIAVVQRRKAISETSPKERREHIYGVVFGAGVSLITPSIFMMSEMCVCYLKAHFMIEGGEFDETDPQCYRVLIGVQPLQGLLLIVTCSSVFYANAQSPFTLENIAQLRITWMQGVEVVLYGGCALFALLFYALRKPGVVAVYQVVGVMVFTVMLVSALAMSGYRPTSSTDDDEDEGGALAERTSGQAARKSLWEGGSMGAQKRLTMKTPSKRGLRAERENQENGEGLEMPSEMTLNGFV